MVKTIFDAGTGELLGAHMIGAEVTELIQGYVVGRTLETTEAELMQTVFPAPDAERDDARERARRLRPGDPLLSAKGRRWAARPPPGATARPGGVPRSFADRALHPGRRRLSRRG